MSVYRQLHEFLFLSKLKVSISPTLIFFFQKTEV